MNLEPMGFYEKSVTFLESFNEENLADIGAYLLEHTLAAQLREMEHVQNMLTFLTFDGMLPFPSLCLLNGTKYKLGCQYQHMGRYFGDKFSVECGHCNYCASKSSIEVRQLPVIGSKPAYDRYKQAFGMAKAGKSKNRGSGCDNRRGV